MSRRLQHGVGLFDALVALAILAFGMLAMVQFQARLLAAGSDSVARLTATQLADELLNLAIVDPANAACYAVPGAGGCASGDAEAVAAAWAARASVALPDASATSAYDPGTGRLTVVIRWTGKSVQEGQPGETHEINMASDVR